MTRVQHTNPNRRAFGDYVTLRLRELGMTRADFAAGVGIGRTTVHRLLTPREEPFSIDIEQIERMAHVLGVDVSVLMDLWDGRTASTRDLASRETLFEVLRAEAVDLSDAQTAHVVEMARQMIRAFRGNGDPKG